MFLSACSQLLYYPDSHMYYNPEQAELTYEDLEFQTSDGVSLHAWYFPAKGQSKSFIAHFHGNAQNLSSHFIHLAWIPEEGHDYFIFDYRGYGQSDSVRPTPKGTSYDGVAALEKAYSLYLESGAEKFVVYGQSLGGIVAMKALEKFEHRDQVDLIVLDSTFSSYRKVARRVMGSNFITWPLQPLSFVLFSDRYAPREFLDQTDIAALVIHSKKDPVVPFSLGRDLYGDLKAERKWFWQLDRREHGAVFYDYDLRYRAKFLELLEEI